ncbi:hypothetical protein ZWY2020_004798, partial [Hordeum vulgare]
MAAASAAASAAAAEAFSIRGFASMMRAVDAAKCWPFGGVEDGTTETPQLPPMDPTPRSRWWADGVAAARARPGFCAAGRDFAVGGGMEDGLRKATKRKGSRGSGGAGRANKRQRALQSLFYLKHKVRSASFRKLKVMFRTGVDILPTNIEDSFVENQNGSDEISETETLKLMSFVDISKQTSLHVEDLVKKEQTPDKGSTCIFPNDAGRMSKTSLPEMQLKSTNVPAYCSEGAKSGSATVQGCFYMNTNCFQEMERPGTSSVAVRTRTEAIKKEDAAVHGLNNTGVTVENFSYCNGRAESGCSNRPKGPFHTNTNCFQEMKRLGTSSVAVRTRTEAITEDRDAAVHGLNNTTVTMAKTCLPEMQLKSTHVPALSSYCEGAKSGSSNRPGFCFYSNTNRFQEMTRPGTSSVAVRTRTEAIEKDRDTAAHGKKSTDISGRLVPTNTILHVKAVYKPSVISQRTFNAGISRWH